MAHDQETYRRGRNTALLGGIVQLLLSVVMVLLGKWARHHGMEFAGYHLLGGLPVWIILWLIYHQHRLERIEALEAEQLSRKDREAAAMFADHADDLDLARRRLETLYKWGLNIVSVVVATYLLGFGLLWLWVVQRSRDFAESQGRAAGGRPVGEHVSAMVLIGALVGLGFVAFAVARYVSGMTKVREWQLLRGGASYLMGNVVVALLLVAGGVALALGGYAILDLSSYFIPGIMALIGLEMLLTFLLSAYRPRRPGEIPRPAFDSRVLGLMTSPESLSKIISDTVNYQFGFEITRSWFYQLLGKALTPLSIFAIVVLVLLSTVVIVEPYEQAVIMVNGRIARIADPGLRFKLPWPIGRAELYAVGEIKEFAVGSVHEDPHADHHAHEEEADHANAPILWTVKHTAGDEEYLITAPTAVAAAGADDDEAGESVPGVSLLAGEVIVQYRIRRDERLEDYARAGPKADELIRAIADRCVGSYYLSRDIDTLLARGRTEAGGLLRTEIQNEADALALGLEILFVGLTGIHPPQDKNVAAAFEHQIAAVLEQETEVEKAKREAIQTLAAAAGSRDYALKLAGEIEAFKALEQRHNVLAADSAERDDLEQQVKKQRVKVDGLLAGASGEAATLVYEARAYRWRRGIGERAAAKRFLAELAAYRQAPQYYRAKRYLDALATGLVKPRKVVIAADVKGPVIELNLEDRSVTEDLLLGGER